MVDFTVVGGQTGYPYFTGFFFFTVYKSEISLERVLCDIRCTTVYTECLLNNRDP